MDEQILWEETLTKFNPTLEINFDKSGVPPSVSHAADDAAIVSPVKETAIVAPHPAVLDAPPSGAQDDSTEACRLHFHYVFCLFLEY